MLEDLVGMIQGLDGDNEEVEMGSDYPYRNELQGSEVIKKVSRPGGVPSTNTTSYEFKNRFGESGGDLELGKLK